VNNDLSSPLSNVQSFTLPHFICFAKVGYLKLQELLGLLLEIGWGFALGTSPSKFGKVIKIFSSLIF